MPLQIEMFPPEIQELNREITYHPKLQELLRMDENSNLDATDKLAVVAAYCQIVLAGYYSQEQLYDLAKILVNKLKQMRVEHIFLVNGTTHKVN